MIKDLTIVFRNVDSDKAAKLLSENPDWNAIARYDAITALGELEDFVRQLSLGSIEHPEDAAQELMTKMKW